MNFLDLCAGIGGFRLGFEKAGMKCVGFCEIDKFARKSYEAMYNTEGEWTAYDITAVTDDEIRQLAGNRTIDLIVGGGSPARHSASQGKEKVFLTQEELSSLKFSDLYKLSAQNILSVRTSKGCFPMTGGELSEPSFHRWQNWGIALNGRFLTARISGYRRIGKECSLSDILEMNVDEKYFLSDLQTEKILANCKK